MALFGTMVPMKWVQARIVDALERACTATQWVDWLPGWHRVYPRCLFARWSSSLDYRWQTGRWAVHDEDGYEAWEQWYDGLSPEEHGSGRWHFW